MDTRGTCQVDRWTLEATPNRWETRSVLSVALVDGVPSHVQERRLLSLTSEPSPTPGPSEDGSVSRHGRHPVSRRPVAQAGLETAVLVLGGEDGPSFAWLTYSAVAEEEAAWMRGKATTEPGPCALPPKPRAQGSNAVTLPPGAQSDPAALSGRAAPCSVCRLHLTPPGASPQSPGARQPNTPSEADPSRVLPKTVRSLLCPGPCARRLLGADTLPGPLIYSSTHLLALSLAALTSASIRPAGKTRKKSRWTRSHRAAVPPNPHEVSERNCSILGSARISPAATQGSRGRSL